MAKAYAARLAVRSWPSMTIPETRNVLPIKTAIGTMPNTSVKLAGLNVWGTMEGG
ncbi:hypothetical protein D3C72_2464650 [compost metagenome]